MVTVAYPRATEVCAGAAALATGAALGIVVSVLMLAAARGEGVWGMLYTKAKCVSTLTPCPNSHLLVLDNRCKAHSINIPTALQNPRPFSDDVEEA